MTNKHLLPVYNKPMIYYPLETLCRAGIRDIMIVTGGNSAGDFLRLLGNGAEFGLKDIYYTYQEGEGGIADALRLCEHFADGERLVVILGDNIFKTTSGRTCGGSRNSHQARAFFFKEVEDLAAFRRPVFEGERIVRNRGKAGQAEEPLRRNRRRTCTTNASSSSSARSNRRRAANSRSPTSTTVHRARESYRYDILEGWWTDAGTFESLFRAGELIARERERLQCGKVNRE